MTSGLAGRNLVSMTDLSASDITAVLDLADTLKRERADGRGRAVFAGKTLAMIFQKPSLRTRVSFEAGMTQLGGHAIYLAPSDISLGQRETTEDIALVLSRMADLILARVFGHDIVEDLAKFATVPVINGLSDREHPCQILADLQTIRQRKAGRLEGINAVYVGDGNNVAHSLLYGAAIMGMSLTIATPAGYEPLEEIAAAAQSMASRRSGNGGSGGGGAATIRVTNDLRAAVRGADVIYTDTWASMGQEAEAARRRAVFAPYQVNGELVSLAAEDVTILHCLPAHYGEEIDHETSRLPGKSAIFDQAENRLHAQKALMLLLLGAEIE